MDKAEPNFSLYSPLFKNSLFLSIMTHAFKDSSSWNTLLCHRIIIWVGRVLKLSQFQHLCFLYGWPCIGSQWDQEQEPSSVMRSEVWLGLGPWQKFKSQHSREKHVLMSHAIQMGKTEVSLARTGHSYWVRNSFPAKKCMFPRAKTTALFCIRTIPSFLAQGKHSLVLLSVPMPTASFVQKPTSDRKQRERKRSSNTLQLLICY